MHNSVVLVVLVVVMLDIQKYHNQYTNMYQLTQVIIFMFHEYRLNTNTEMIRDIQVLNTVRVYTAIDSTIQ